MQDPLEMKVFRTIKAKVPEYMKYDVVGGKGPKPKPMLPTVRFDLGTLPEAKKWDVGDEYEIHLKVKMSGLHIHDGFHMESPISGSAEFDITAIRAGELVKKAEKPAPARARRYTA